jgi:branched-chain amino acid transport system permease protein
MTILVVEAVVTGIMMGSVYALMASGLTLVYGVLEIINIAQGILVVLGAYLSYVLQRALHLDLFVGLLLTIPVMFGLGVVIDWSILRRIKQDRIMLSILAMYAVALTIEGALNFFFSGDYVQLQAWYVDATIPMFGFYLPYIYLFAFFLSVALLTLLYILVYRTSFGRSLRASMQNPTAASLIGIDVPRVQTVTFGIGIALAAAGGMVFGTTGPFNPASSYDLISRLLVIIVLGGMGSLWGALGGSLLMLVVQNVTAVVWSPVWSSTVFFLLLIVLLLRRQQGLFGRREGRKL